ncbi:MAG: hypothetical protein WC804_10935 [Sphingomonas sp.]|uniref:hypothetical protein n=1 Tax=Sphingomonas sp. TaxID=28214 RepID=UPI0035622CD1
MDRHRPHLVPHVLIRAACAEFALDRGGVHGTGHWERVRVNGAYLAEREGANRWVVEIFAYIHDIKRHHDGGDPEHGLRAADWAQWANGRHFELSGEELDLLVRACTHHSKGLTEEDVTVQCCWDADRLDLGRTGKVPHPKYLCTATGRNPRVIEWAYARSLRHRRKG